MMKCTNAPLITTMKFLSKHGDVWESHLTGRRHCKLTIRYANGHVEEGWLRDGKKIGKWTIRQVKETTFFYSPNFDGDFELRDYWKTRYTDINGDEHEGFCSFPYYTDPIEADERIGKWTIRSPNGTKLHKGKYKHGKKHGKWLLRWHNDCVETGEYVDGLKEGKWEYFADGTPQGFTTYVNGGRHGPVECHYGDGRVETGNQAYNRQHGKWEIRYPDGTVKIEHYVDGVKQE